LKNSKNSHHITVSDEFLIDQYVHNNLLPHMRAETTSVIFWHLIWIPTRKYIASSLAIYQDDFAPQCFFRTISLCGFRV